MKFREKIKVRKQTKLFVLKKKTERIIFIKKR